MTQKKGPYIRPVLMALLLVAMIAVSAQATDSATSYKEYVPPSQILIHYSADTSVTEVMDEIYIQASLRYTDGSSPLTEVAITQIEPYYNMRHATASGTYSNPAPGDYQAHGYRALVENGVVSKSWFDQIGWTQV
jgi:hypothetical protein